MEFEIISPDDNNYHFLEIQIDYTDTPTNALFKKIEGNIDLILLTSKTIQYFLNMNDVLNGLHSLTFYVFDSMTRIHFQEDSTTIYFGTEAINFQSMLTNSISIISEIAQNLDMSIVPNVPKIFPLSLIVINDNAIVRICSYEIKEFGF